MHTIKRPLLSVLIAIAVCLLVQIGFAVGVFGPAWMSPVLSLPALALITWLWRRAERDRQATRAFTDLVI